MRSKETVEPDKLLFEKELLQEIQKGDEESRDFAFTRLYNYLEPGILKIIYATCPQLDESSVDDVSQETWIVIAEKIDDYEFRGIPISRWTGAIARRVAKSYSRKAHFNNSETPLFEFFKNTQDPESDNPDMYLEQMEAYEVLVRVIDNLPSKTQRVMKGLVNGLDAKELAEQEQTSVANIYQRVAHGRKLLKPFLHEFSKID